MRISFGLGLARSALGITAAVLVAACGGAPDSGAGSPQISARAEAQALTTVRNLPIVIALHGQATASSPLSYSIVDQPAHGALSGLDPNAGIVTYTPEPGWTGKDVFSFRANDGAAAGVTIDVVAAPRAIAQAMSITTNEDEPARIELFAPGSPAPVTYAIASMPEHGSLVAAGPGIFTYTPHANYAGADSFAYMATDDGVTFTRANVSISVAAVNDAPVATGESGRTLYVGVPMTFTLHASDAESSEQALVFEVGGAVNGVLGPVKGNKVTFTPSGVGPASFVFTASDGEAKSKPTTIAIGVSAIAADCRALRRAGYDASGVYPVDPDGDGSAFPAMHVRCDQTTLGGGWTRVFNHDVRGGGTYFASKADALLRNANDPESATASILKHVGGFGGNSGFEMMLRWPDSPGIANVWVQTSNPIGPGPVTGYRGIRLDRNAGHWAGLRPSAMASALLTGDADEQVQPWFAVGQLASRGHEGLSVSPEEGVDGTTAWTQLWVRSAPECGDGIVDEGETCDDGNTTDGDGCSARCAVERTHHRTCLEIKKADASAGDGTYVIDPDGSGPSAPLTTFCDMTRDGGGWTLIAKAGQSRFLDLTDEGYKSIVLNPTDDVGAIAFGDGTYPATGAMSFFNRSNTNALFGAAAGKVVRVDMTANEGDEHANGTYFQKRIAPPENWDFWAAMRSARMWNADGTTSKGLWVSGFGTDFVLTRYALSFDPATNTVTHTATNDFGYWDEYAHALNDGSTLTVSRHGGLVNDSHGAGWQWLLTFNPNDFRWKNDMAHSKSRVWLR